MSTNPVSARKVFCRYLSEREEAQLFKHVGQFAGTYARRDLAMMQLMRYTGIRVGTLCRLTIGDAMAALRDKHLALASDKVKGRKAYTVFLGTKAAAALSALIQLRKNAKCIVPDHPLCAARAKKLRPMTVRAVQLRMSKWVMSAGLSVDATPHWLRHTLAKRLMARSTAEDPQLIAQFALGHSDRRSTAIYTMPDKEAMQLAMEESQ